MLRVSLISSKRLIKLVDTQEALNSFKFSMNSTNACFIFQEIPEEVYKMAERYDVWKKKKESEQSCLRGNRNAFGGGRRGYRRT